MMKQLLITTALIFTCIITLQTCEEDPTGPSIGPLYLIEVTPPAVNMEIDSTQQFMATGRDVDMNVIPNLTFTWTSRYPLVGAIDENGLLSCISEGTTMITAKSGSIESAQVSVNVYDPVFSIALSPSTLTIDCSAQITATAKDMNGDDITGLSFIWESDNTHIASVDDNGQTVGVGIGTTSITASFRDVTSPPLTVTVNGTFQKPSAITATAISDNTLELNWNDRSSCEEGFIIERDGGSGFDSLTVVNSGITQYLDSDLDGSASYTYRVAGFISSYISDWSTSSVSNLAPQSPTNLSASSISDTEIQLTWTDNTGFETGFKVERDAGSGFVEIGTVSADVTEYTDTGLTFGQSYDYRVAAYSAENTSSWATITTATEFAAPSDLTATSVIDSEIQLSWTDNTGFETGFKVERDAGSGFVEIGTVSADVTEYTDTGLTAWQNYDYRVAAYTASNASDYSATVTMSTYEPMVDYDGNVYKTIQIGDQIWMAENLRVTHYRDGTAIPNLTVDGAWTSTSSGAFCYYDNDAGNGDTYGALYNWYAVDDSRDIAPEGWHVPTDDDWKELEMYLGMSQSEADDISERGTNEGSKLAGNAALWDEGTLENDSEFGTSGFTALPGGFRYHSSGSYGYMGNFGWFWSATREGSGFAWHRRLNCEWSNVYRSYDFKRDGFSVRLVRD